MIIKCKAEPIEIKDVSKQQYGRVTWTRFITGYIQIHKWKSVKKVIGVGTAIAGKKIRAVLLLFEYHPMIGNRKLNDPRFIGEKYKEIYGFTMKPEEFHTFLRSVYDAFCLLSDADALKQLKEFQSTSKVHTFLEDDKEEEEDDYETRENGFW